MFSRNFCKSELGDYPKKKGNLNHMFKNELTFCSDDNMKKCHTNKQNRERRQSHIKHL